MVVKSPREATLDFGVRQSVTGRCSVNKLAKIASTVTIPKTVWLDPPEFRGMSKALSRQRSRY